jgi:hydrogenase/urease accessory protein HupE
MRIISYVLLFMCLSSTANAHKLAPSLLELRELPSGVIGLMWKTPLLAASPPAVVLPASCRTLDRVDQTINEGAVVQRYTILCAEAVPALAFSISGLSASRSAALLRWYANDDSEQQMLLGSDEDSFSPAERGTGGPPLLQFTGLGIKHILIGSDHLLFVLGLLLVASNRYRLLVWISAFTVGHSITLLLVSIGVIPRWPALAEWLIAASVLVMALYVDRRRDAVDLERHSKSFVVLVGAFGLLHGLGFASVLEELMLPRGDMVPALLGFNIGIELGQIFFIAVVALLLFATRQLLAGWPAWQAQSLALARVATMYVMGSVAVYWMIDRGLILFEATFRGVY